jgi:DNA-binding winged helix-turn-helix (wHTH) protein
MIFAFGDCEIDIARRELLRSGSPCHVEPQVFDLLVHLIAHRDRVVDKAELLDAVWGGRAVSESTLTSRISAARRAIGDSGDHQTWLRTVARRGFRCRHRLSIGTDKRARLRAKRRAAWRLLARRRAQDIERSSTARGEPDRAPSTIRRDFGA